jgi:hypothetical protein
MRYRTSTATDLEEQDEDSITIDPETAVPY